MLFVKKRALALCLCLVLLCQYFVPCAAADEPDSAFTVTLHIADRTETLTVDAGGVVEELPEPDDADGLRFVSWRDEDGAVVFPQTREVTADTVYTALFAPELDPEHVSYISGYDDGRFHPDDHLTRAEACAMLLKLLPEDFEPPEPEPPEDKSSTGTEVPAPPVLDGGADSEGADSESSENTNIEGIESAVSENIENAVPDESSDMSVPVPGPEEYGPVTDTAEPEPAAWYDGAVETFSRLGLLRPDEDGSLRPTEAITRAEFISMLGGFYPIYPAEARFFDLSREHPAYAETAFAVDMGWAGGYEDGTFRPDAPLTRAEAVTILSRALGRGGDAGIKTYRISRFIDLPVSHWAYAAVMEASTEHTHELDEGGAEHWLTWPELYLEPGFHYDGGELFYVSPETGWYVSDTVVNGFRFDADGRYTSGSAELDGYVKNALAQITAAGMTREEMLHAAYNYTRDGFTYLRRNYYNTGDTGWETENALVMFQTRYGNCYCYAAVFYFLARQLGYDATAISGTVGSNRAPHGWVEIDFDGVTNIFDTELEMSYRAKGVYHYDFYMMPYSRIPWAYDGPAA